MSETALTRFLAEQTVARLREMRSELREEVDKAHRRIEELEADLARVETALNERPRGSRVRSVQVPSRPAGAPRVPMKDEILEILATRPQEAWTTQDVLDALESRGTAPKGKKPLNTVGNRLVDLQKARKVHRHRPGTYSLSPPPTGLFSNSGGGESD